jgi:hypothetical protein
MPRLPALLLVTAIAALAVAAGSGAAPPKLFGTVGPGFTITLNRFGKPLKMLPPGTYSITVNDKSDIHNFHLKGPGVDKEITSIGFKGFKTVTVTLKKGTYLYVCDPHFTTMKATFKVG